MTILWSQIEAECGDFREGFVATFRKYEGQPTDEIDGRNARVKVTVASFARHAGINVRTFLRWTKDDVSSWTTDEKVKADKRAARRLPPEEKAALVRELVKSEPKVALAASDALDERHTEWQASRPAAQDRPDTARNEHIEATTLLVKLRSARRNLVDAASLAQNIRGIGEDEMRTAVLSEVEEQRALLEIIEAGVNGGPLDSQLQALLDSEAGK